MVRLWQDHRLYADRGSGQLSLTLPRFLLALMCTVQTTLSSSLLGQLFRSFVLDKYATAFGILEFHDSLIILLQKPTHTHTYSIYRHAHLVIIGSCCQSILVQLPPKALFHTDSTLHKIGSGLYVGEVIKADLRRTFRHLWLPGDASRTSPGCQKWRNSRNYGVWVFTILHNTHGACFFDSCVPISTLGLRMNEVTV